MGKMHRGTWAHGYEAQEDVKCDYMYLNGFDK